MFQVVAQGLAAGSQKMDIFVNPENALATGLLMGVLAIAGVICCIGILLQYPRIKGDWASRAAWLRARPWGGMSVLVLVAALIFIHAGAGAAAFILKKFFHVALEDNETALFIVQGIVFHGVILVAIGFMMALLNMRWADAFGCIKPLLSRIAQGLLFGLGMLPAVWMAAIITQIVMFMTGMDPSLQDVIYYFASDHGWAVRVYMLVFGIVVAPVAEELFFRGLLFPVLSKAVSVKWGVISSSLIFAVIHLHVPAIAPLFIVALACALAYMYTRSLVVPIVMHASFNALNMGMLLLLNG